ncbi:MAG: hypothetical protein ACI3ZQ_06050 [Candidatus Cryptobacteroides sp.]
MLNGKKIVLTPEQVKLIQADGGEKTPFDIVDKGKFYYINSDLAVYGDSDMRSPIDNHRFNAANYCTDKNIMKQHALHMQLNNLLWRYSMTHGGDEIEFGNFSTQKYYITYDADEKEFYADWNDGIKSVGAIYFKSDDTADAAIKEIIEPFVAAHPDFDVTKM